MNTKQRIIDRAIKLYNNQGVINITSRDLAKSLRMSHGNVEYHFPNKESLLKAIYDQMKREISGVYEEVKTPIDPFLHFNELLVRLEAFHKAYSFFNLDVLEISRNYKEVNQLLKNTFQIRRTQMIHFYGRFKEFGYFKEEINQGMYLRLEHTVRILITFWDSQREILPYFTLAQQGTMSTYIWELLVPHMTKKGMKAYRELVLNSVEDI